MHLVLSLAVVQIGRKHVVPLHQRVGALAPSRMELQRPYPMYDHTTTLEHAHNVAHLRARVDPLVAAALAENKRLNVAFTHKVRRGGEGEGGVGRGGGRGGGGVGWGGEEDVRRRLTRPKPPFRASTNPA